MVSRKMLCKRKSVYKFQNQTHGSETSDFNTREHTQRDTRMVFDQQSKLFNCAAIGVQFTYTAKGNFGAPNERSEFRRKVHFSAF